MTSAEWPRVKLSLECQGYMILLVCFCHGRLCNFQAGSQLLLMMLHALQSYNEKSDVYSFGVILWELFMGQEPWQDKNAMQVTASILLCQAACLLGAACSHHVHGSCVAICTVLRAVGVLNA